LNTKERIIINGMILTTALLQGSSYAVRKMGFAYIGPLFFNGLRFLVAFLFAITAYFIQNRMMTKGIQEESSTLKPISYQIQGGVFVGVTYGIGSALQQWGLFFTAAGKVGFITSLYTILVPLISWLVLNKAIKRQVWVGAIFAFAGLSLISFDGSFGISAADGALIISAIIFSMQIIVFGYFSKHSNPLILVSAQMFTGALVSMALATIFENGNTLTGVVQGLFPIVYSGVFALGLANILQSHAQKKASSSITAILLSFESVFGAIFGIVLLSERMKALQWIGCLLIFSAALISQLEIAVWKKSYQDDRNDCENPYSQ
jgi:drug/metabolite transporter (DMT)-like permease